MIELSIDEVCALLGRKDVEIYQLQKQIAGYAEKFAAMLKEAEALKAAAPSNKSQRK